MGFVDRLIDAYNVLKETIFNGILKITEFFTWFIDYISNFLATLLIWFEAIFDRVVEKSIELVTSPLQALVTACPDLSSYYADYDGLGAYLGYVNTWVDLSLACQLFAAWVTFAVAFAVVKITVKLIPGVG